MHLGNDIRSIWESYNTDTSEQIPGALPGQIPELGVKIVVNDEGDNDGDRYYETWEIHPIDSTTNGKPLDWDYKSSDETLENKVAQVRRIYKLTRRLAFN